MLEMCEIRKRAGAGQESSMDMETLCQCAQVTGSSYKGNTGQKKTLLARVKRTLTVQREKIIGIEADFCSCQYLDSKQS